METKKAEPRLTGAHASKEKPRKEQRKQKEKRQKEKSIPESPSKNIASSVATNPNSSITQEKVGKSNNSAQESLKKDAKEVTETINRLSSNTKENNSSSATSKNVSKNETRKKKSKEILQTKIETPPPPTPPPPPVPPQEKPEKEDDEPGSSSNESVSSTSPEASVEKDNGPLATMIAEMEEQNIISPMSSDQEEDDDEEEDEPNKRRRARSERSSSKENRNTSDTPNQKVFHKTANTNGNSRQNSPATPPHSTNTSSEPDDATEEAKKPIDHAYLNELKDLQGKIMSLKDRQHLQRIVDLIEETGLYQVSGATFDFDLCSLDRSTVQKLQKFLAVK